MSKESFQGRLALITGGSSGMGLAVAKLLVQEGARVWLVARRRNVLEEAQKTLLALSSDHRAEIFPADVTDRNQVQAAVEHVTRQAGVPDLLMNVAGASHPGYLQDTTLSTYHEMMDLNYFGTVHMVQALLPGMLARGSGYIVNFSSLAGFMAPFGYAAYVPSKYAVRGYSDLLRLELKPLGIRVSVVFPPDTDTPGMANENKTKPYETLEAFSSKLESADQVAGSVLRGMRRGQYVILPGLEAALYYRLMPLLGNAIYPIFDLLLAQARRKKASAQPH
ncbi:MAG TPA: SDR family oxidoreductase [Anaerolineales bacterium]|nr:SDR family oxidoreductase [Anaerolineales bacterium]